LSVIPFPARDLAVQSLHRFLYPNSPEVLVMRWSLLCLLALPLVPVVAADDGWKPLAFDKDLTAWRPIKGGFELGGDAVIDGKNNRQLAAKEGTGVFVAPKGCPNLVSKEKFGDVEIRCEFLIPKNSNSGVKLNGQYEIQIRDTAGKKVEELTGDCLGGVYPKAELKPKYHHIDKGVPPKVNAAKSAGEWQTLHIVFQAPRFEGDKKVANAKFIKVVLNGQVIHENQELLTPTGNAYVNKESATGPLLIQTDHGGVAFRKVEVRPLAK
jgi:hypothetical protein